MKRSTFGAPQATAKRWTTLSTSRREALPSEWATALTLRPLPRQRAFEKAHFAPERWVQSRARPERQFDGAVSAIHLATSTSSSAGSNASTP